MALPGAVDVPPVGGYYAGSLRWGCRRDQDRLDAITAVGSMVGSVPYSLVTQSHYVGPNRRPVSGEETWGCAWSVGGAVSPSDAPDLWFPRVLVTGDSYDPRARRVTIYGRSVAGPFRCSPLDAFLVPAVVHGDRTALGALADWLDEHEPGTNRALLVRSLFANPPALRANFVQALVNQFG